VRTLGTLTVRHAPASAGQVRRHLADDLARQGMPGGVVENAALLVSELVGNSVRYAHPLPGGVLRVHWFLDSDRLVLRVTDGGGWDRPRRREAGPRDTRGRGLAIVDAMAADWGVERKSDTGGDPTTVWATLHARPSGADGRSADAASASPCSAAYR
jgi:anti-sigma regulatory factor (Ser/Thr protein kinase)